MMAFANSHILYRTFLISHKFNGKSGFRSICPSKARYFHRRKILQNGFYCSNLPLEYYVSTKEHVYGLLISKQKCPYNTCCLTRRNIWTYQNKHTTTFKLSLDNQKWNSVRFLNSHGKRGGQKFDRKSRNLFDILEVTPKSHKSDIKKSFYRLSKLYHPDMNKSDEAAVKFAEISAAYEVLKDPTKRRLYERGMVISNDRHVHHQDIHKSTSVNAEEYFNSHISEKSRVKRRAISQDNDFWFYYASMKDSRKYSHENIDTVLKSYKEDEQYRKRKGFLGGTFVCAFLLAVFLMK